MYRVRMTVLFINLRVIINSLYVARDNPTSIDRGAFTMPSRQTRKFLRFRGKGLLVPSCLAISIYFFPTLKIVHRGVSRGLMCLLEPLIDGGARVVGALSTPLT